MTRFLFSCLALFLFTSVAAAQTYMPARPYPVTPPVQLNLNVLQATAQQLNQPPMMPMQMQAPQLQMAPPMVMNNPLREPAMVPRQVQPAQTVQPVQTTQPAPVVAAASLPAPAPVVEDPAPQLEVTSPAPSKPKLMTETMVAAPREMPAAKPQPLPKPWPQAVTKTEQRFALPLTKGPAPEPVKPVVESQTTAIAAPSPAPVVAKVVEAPQPPQPLPAAPVAKIAPTPLVTATPSAPEPVTVAVRTPDTAPTSIAPRPQIPDFITFSNQAAVLSDGDKIILDEIASTMNSDATARLQLRAFAGANDGQSTSQARRLSLARALAVRSYLLEQGVKAPLMDIRALGSDVDGAQDRPADRVDIVLQRRG